MKDFQTGQLDAQLSEAIRLIDRNFSLVELSFPLISKTESFRVLVWDLKLHASETQSDNVSHRRAKSNRKSK